MASIAISEMFSFVARSAWNVSISKDRTYPLKVGLVKGEVPVDLELWRSFWGTLRPVPLPGLVFFLLGLTFLASVDIQYLINWGWRWRSRGSGDLNSDSYNESQSSRNKFLITHEGAGQSTVRHGTSRPGNTWKFQRSNIYFCCVLRLFILIS